MKSRSAATTFILTLLVGAPFARGQSSAYVRPEPGGRELAVFSGSGAGVRGFGLSGATAGNVVWYVGLRYGWVLTDAHGPGFLRGRFEYAMDVIPVLLVLQEDGTAYGFSLHPIVLKWNFARTHGAAPYFESSAGGLVTTHQIPRGASRLNFTPGAAFGVRFPGRRNYWSLEIRYLHISDAFITNYNPGTDTVGLRLSFGRFTH
jgi:hypothetical protein